ncbi:DUF4430 domain-containing protein [Virgibacillus sp. MG-45]|uniref:DUF4430 domain-containing protein n=1 Tax=Virgibacillus sp. MG-45 TaxID=3102791 RepID=UPI002ED9AC0C
MKVQKWIYRLLPLLLVASLLAGCGSTDEEKSNKPASNQTEQQASGNESDSKEKEETVVITISKDKGKEQITEKEVPIKEDAILMDVLKENFQIEEEGGFINAVEGIAPKKDEKKAWMYSVNGEVANVGAAEYKLKPGDKVTLDLQSWE